MVKIIAHRGASGYCPENTMVAFKKAIAQKSDGIELDVHLSKDGYIMICHDETIDRTTNGTGRIKEMSYDEIRKYDAGAWFNKKYEGEKIPTLNEFFDLMKDNDLLINIELKAGSMLYPGIESKVLDLIEEYDFMDRVIVSSFDHHSVVKCKELNPNIKTGALYELNLYEPWVYATEKLGADALHPHYKFVDKELISQLEPNNLMLNIYTVNDTDLMKYYYNMGVTSIITNYPDLAKSVVQS